MTPTVSRVAAAMSLVAMFLLGGLVTMLVLVVRLNGTADTNLDNITVARMNTEQIKAVSVLLTECVVAPSERGATPDPAHPDCYERQQTQVAAAVMRIVDADSSGCLDVFENRYLLGLLTKPDLLAVCPQSTLPRTLSPDPGG